MITPVHFRKFFFAFLAIFGFAWMGLVVLPWMELGHLEPMPQAGGNDILPWDVSGLAHAGEQVYAANGCVYCHTQQVRAPQSGADLVRGWGTARRTRPATSRLTSLAALSRAITSGRIRFSSATTASVRT